MIFLSHISTYLEHRLFKRKNKIDNLLYHCIVREEDKFFLFEEEMKHIDVNKLQITSKRNSGNITFTDGQEYYNFSVSKSTLYKRFSTNEEYASVKVEILDDPLAQLGCLNLGGKIPDISRQLVLPLYSFRGRVKTVFKKSGLNMWNAKGRKRNPDEIYISFPSEVRTVFETFFPCRGTDFDVLLPNGNTISMKVCQDNSKALSSNPNKALGKWLLREILEIPKGTLVSYDTLLAKGIDAVVFEKVRGKYTIDFVRVGGYEDFLYDNVLTDV